MRYSYFIFTVAIGILLGSCKTDEDFIGPELVIVDPATFSFTEDLETSNDTIDFETTSASFTAKFNQRVNWTITLKGNTSGAIKTLTGTGEEIETANTNWDGSFDLETKLKLFQDEKVIATVSVLGVEETKVDTFDIINPLKPFVLLNGFNTPEEYANPIFFISGDTPDIFTVSQETSADAPEGEGFISLYGKDIAPSGEYFIGNFGTNNGGVYDKKQVLKNSADELYLNFFLKGEGPDGTPKLEVQFEELFGDIFSVEVSTKHTGWKFVSIPYSGFINNWAMDSNPAGQAGVREANLVKGMGFICSSLPSRKELNIAIDYACLTIGKPLIETE